MMIVLAECALYVNMVESSILNKYQEKSWSFALDTAKNSAYLYTGLAGEVGELCSLFAKATRDKTTVEHSEFMKEAGDCLWFLAALCTYHGVSLEDVAEANIKKLQGRKDRNTIGGSGNDR